VVQLIRSPRSNQQCIRLLHVRSGLAQPPSCAPLKAVSIDRNAQQLRGFPWGFSWGFQQALAGTAAWKNKGRGQCTWTDRRSQAHAAAVGRRARDDTLMQNKGGGAGSITASTVCRRCAASKDCGQKALPPYPLPTDL
jgi:hypothetical protein